MLTIAYFANEFPTVVEPYVGWEIHELRRREVQIIAGSARRPEFAQPSTKKTSSQPQTLFLRPLRMITVLRALWIAVYHCNRIFGLIARICFKGSESPARRLKALLHTWFGAYYAVLLRPHHVDHIHVHHGYFGSWIAMVAARLLGVSFSLTLHGSDLLLDGSFLDTKLANCKFCLTISEYNRRYILRHLPATDARKIIVSRLGVDIPEESYGPAFSVRRERRKLRVLAVGRLHVVKNHAFLIRACAQLVRCGLDFDCQIAGEGLERQNLELLIRRNRLEKNVRLIGHIAGRRLDSLYRSADVVVLTSNSEGIPLVLMEAMARGGIVLAPAITGVPEIVVPGKTGFLYISESLEDFLAKIVSLQEQIAFEGSCAVSRLDWIRHAARVQILQNFNRRKNLIRFADQFLQRAATET